MSPMVTAVATLEVDMAANMLQARMVATASPPGRCPTHLEVTSNISSLTPPLCITCPARIKRGRQARAKLFSEL